MIKVGNNATQRAEDRIYSYQDGDVGFFPRLSIAGLTLQMIKKCS